MSIETDLDRLYQLKPAEFTAERNAIAKRAGPRAADVKSLPKPTAAVWAVNQLYWRKPELYRSLIRAAENLRATHKAVMGGRRADLRAASRAHEEALEAALKATLDIASEDGQGPSDTTRQAIGTTLRGLPADDPPGRLRQALAPGGFEMLSGLPAGGRVISPSARKPEQKADTANQERARKPSEAVVKAIAAAEQVARREEFEAARTAREAEKAERRLARAREAFESAEAEVKEAEREVEQARKKRDAAKARSDAADQALADARSRAD